MVESLHHLIDQLAGIFLALLSKMQVDHGGFELGMAHVPLDDAEVDAGFEEMGGIAMAQGMDGDASFVDCGFRFGPTEGALDAALGHGRRSRLCRRAASADGREEELGMVVGEPIAAEQLESGLGERHIAVLGAFAPVDMDHHALAVDIGGFEMEAFVESQAAGVDGGEIGKCCFSH
jgi:hypothetical protein